jgi:hypothetical protein
MSRTEQDRLTETAISLYERFGAPLEREHLGEHVAIAPDGRYVLASSLTAALADGATRFGRGNFVFKIGDRVVGACRWWPRPSSTFAYRTY